MKNPNVIFTVLLLAIACLSVAPVVQARQQSEDRGNGNSAAEGVDALNLSTTGSNNTAHGWFSLFSNTTGNNNVANGFNALFNNTTGSGNTANGRGALFANTTGFSNTATGAQALTSNTIGGDNTAVGNLALSLNTTGFNNTANGFQALLTNTTGAGNTAIGVGALVQNTTGNENSALGANAGFYVTTANNVVCIGSLGANVSNSTWIENIYGVITQSGTTAPVVVSDTGQLGTLASSQRFKKDIASMDKASEAILSLRPVTFHYKTDAKDISQFGLIAEEVAKVNPSLVLPDKEGKPYTVRYDVVNAMLLNEFLKEHRRVEEQDQRLQKQEATIVKQQKQIEALTAGFQRVSAQIETTKATPTLVLNNP